MKVLLDGGDPKEALGIPRSANVNDRTMFRVRNGTS
jgi:hypothetical protein